MPDLHKRVRILIVDDSLTFRTVLGAELSKHKELEVVSFASDPYEARHKLKFFNPDVMVLDIVMPKMDGVEFVKRLMGIHPIPIVVISSIKEYIEMAVQAGAIDGIAKPQAGEDTGVAHFAARLAEKIILASKHTNRLKSMIAQGADISAGRTSAGRASADHASVERAHAEHTHAEYTHAEHTVYERVFEERGADRPAAAYATTVKKTNIEIIVIGASTGGTNAIADIMSALPSGLPGIVIVQHMPAEFTDMFAKRLDSSCAMSVYEARSGDKLSPGTALVAPGGFHLRMAKSGDEYTALVQAGDKVNGHCPSVDVLFSSVAECAGRKAIGVLLTGMGSDGAKGLLEMKKAGAKTIGQDESSSVVYGMPKVAHDIGAVVHQVPLAQIARQILSLL